MIFEVVTIFPDFFASILEHGVLERARAGGQVEIRLHDLRDFTDDRHRTVDDRPFGGGPGMVFKPEPLFRAVEALRAEAGGRDFPVILLSPQGHWLTQAVADEFARQERLVLLCGRYEGVDERVAQHLATEELSIGDYVLTGGEIAAAVVMEAVTRLLPGVLGNEESSAQDSFAGAGSAEGSHSGSARGILDCPHYTRPAEFRGWRVPEVLLSGNHEEIRRGRRRVALEKTWRRRPDLLASLSLSEEDRQLLEEIRQAALESVARPT
ncbi:MAG: tRNA (guanosine(37)-N1)-methyltransferase TrmD [Acidobacteriia bacterium]|nr:tRNA (guanosine(37)-N1)-methyltransferase TrmD [Terriglobia bacterium]